MALFVAGKAFTGPPFQDPAKMGAVLSAGVAVLALVMGYILKVKDGAGAENEQEVEQRSIGEQPAGDDD